MNGGKKNQELVKWEDHLDGKYGKEGTAGRIEFEECFEQFKIGILIQEARRSRNLTQAELAERMGTTKNYISRIENDASDIRLSTLIRLVQDGLKGELKLTLPYNPEINNV